MQVLQLSDKASVASLSTKRSTFSLPVYLRRLKQAVLSLFSQGLFLLLLQINDILPDMDDLLELLPV
ncbi:MAG: hypothetical protein Q8908_08380 [Bacteroidota bacterium]|nr:hypothetical protein [Bacteroidota bacterium]